MPSVDKIHLIWLQGQACTGCTVSFLNATHPSVLDLLTGFIPQATGITLDYHATIMAPWGDEAIEALRSAERGELEPFVLIVEGAVPDESFHGDQGFWCVTGEDEEGNPITFNERLDKLAKNAAALVAVGTCASFGGIPSGKPNPTGAMGVLDYLGPDWRSALNIPVVCVPGCPVHGEHLAETLTSAVLAVRGYLPVPDLDEFHRPKFIYGTMVHDTCPLGGYYSDWAYSKEYGEPYCMELLGCKGPMSHCDAPKRGFIEGVGGCTTCGSPCIGCTEPGFPDAPFSPFMKRESVTNYFGRTLNRLLGRR